ncbi:hypothetical protein PROFUN_14188 [Planoprotostelium fungivorum]|uniref:Uncharacterized protein n=1 Tax=Planoprotostelium fungivorum TaxID=1890364 RepID=A0A2P6N0R0_9EUKA|nr:hypothetical protein PROFUN_14188 [Planoprotostelium fungivorum]
MTSIVYVQKENIRSPSAMVLSNVSPFLGGPYHLRQGYEFSGVTERTAEENQWISSEDLRESHYGTKTLKV